MVQPYAIINLTKGKENKKNGKIIIGKNQWRMVVNKQSKWENSRKNNRRNKTSIALHNKRQWKIYLGGGLK